MNICTNCGSLIPEGKYVCSRCGWQYSRPEQEVAHNLQEVSKAEPVGEVVTPLPAENATAPLLKRVDIFLEDENWTKADEYCEKVLDMEPENGKAYLGKLLAEMKLRNAAALKEQTKSFEDKDNCRKALRYGDETVVSSIEAALTQIRTRKMQTGMARKKLAAERAEKLKKLCRSIGAAIIIMALLSVVFVFVKNAGKEDPVGNADGLITASDSISHPDQDLTIPSESVVDKQNIQVGETILFGKYEQDGNPDNGTEEIEWIVLEAEGGRALLISKYALYGEGYMFFSYNEDGEWVVHGVDHWLTKEFYDSAFSVEEKLLVARLSYPSEGGAISAEDSEGYEKVFLLSEEEMVRYFPNKSDRVCAPTIYAQVRTGLLNGACSWWLRAESDSDVVPIVATDGSLIFRGLSETGSADGVRPVIWMDMDRICEPNPSEDTVSADANIDIPSDLKAGDYITFGRYEQDNDLFNGAEPIEWLVLGVQDGRALLISRYSLDSFPHSTQAPDATWETGIVRSWLNDEFINTAFNETERAKIPTVTLSMGENPDISSKTQDKIYLLSIPEVNRYFPYESLRVSEATPYAISRNVRVDNEGNCYWYLRSPGSTTRNLACVTFNGNIDGLSDGRKVLAYAGVRPVLWIEMES